MIDHDPHTVAPATVRDLDDGDIPWKLSVLEQGWGATVLARLGERIDGAELPGFVAVRGDERVGLLSYAERPDGLEVVTLQALVESRGIGRLLLDHARERAVAGGAPRMWLITTNDNIRAIGFYQRYGMNLARVVIDGVTHCRNHLKPEIPTHGNDGIPIRHELLFELDLRR